MTIRVSTEGGATIEFPDGTDSATIARVMGGKSQTPPSVEGEVAQQGLLGFNRGVNSLIALPGEIIGGAVNLVAPGEGDRFKWDNPVSRAVTRPDIQPQTDAGRYAEAAGKAVGASAIPTAAIVSAAPRLAAAVQPATSTLGQIAQQAGRHIAANPGAAVAADVTSAATSGIAQQGAADAGFGPTGQMVAGIAGGLAPMGIAAATQPARTAIARARANQGEAGAYGKIAESLDGPVTTFADEVATGGTPMNAGINRRTMDVLGEEMERAGGDVARAQQATITRLSTEFGIPPNTAASQIQRLTDVHRGSQLMLAEYPAVARSNADTRGVRAANTNLDDVARTQESPTQFKLDTLGNNGNTQSASTVRNAINQREEALSPALAETLVESGPRMGGRPASIVDVENMIANADQLASTEYRAAHNGPVNNNLMLNWLPRLLAWHENRAAYRAGDIARAINSALDQFYVNTPNGRITMNTLQQLQDARGVLRGQITQYRTQGRNDLVNAVQPVYDHITRLMTHMSPQWAQANRRWADGRLNEVAAELGDAFAKQAGPRFREQMREFNQLAPEAQNVVRVHWIQQQLDRLTNLPDTHSVSKMFTNDHMRNMVRQLLGDQAAVDFTRMVRDIKVAEASKAMMKNSSTHRRGMAQKQEDADTGLIAAANNASAQGVRNWLVERATQLLSERRNAPMANILTTPMSDTAQIARHLYRMRQQQDRLRQIDSPTRITIPIGSFAGMPFSEDRRQSELARYLKSGDVK